MNDQYTKQKVLIASQGSEYKNAVVMGVTDYLKTEQVFVKIIDVSELTNINLNESNVIFVLDIWQIQEAQFEGSFFLKINMNPIKFLLF